MKTHNRIALKIKLRGAPLATNFQVEYTLLTPFLQIHPQPVLYQATNPPFYTLTSFSETQRCSDEQD